MKRTRILLSNSLLDALIRSIDVLILGLDWWSVSTDINRAAGFIDTKGIVLKS